VSCKNSHGSRGIESLSAESMQPDVVLVGFDFDGDFFYVGGMNILKSTKYKMYLKIIKLHLS
jgi:hypothetical protein